MEVELGIHVVMLHFEPIWVNGVLCVLGLTAITSMPSRREKVGEEIFRSIL